MDNFNKELTALLNRHQKDTQTSTADYLLAYLLNRQINAFADTMLARDEWVKESTADAHRSAIIRELIEKADAIGATIHSPQFVTTDRATGEELLYSTDLATWLKSQTKEE